MKTAHCPKTHTKLAEVAVRKDQYGHVPGHNYHDVNVVISRRSDHYRCHIVEHWGSAQGYDEEHGRVEVTGHGESIGDAAQDAQCTADEAGIHESLLPQALSQAIDAAEEFEANESE